MSLREKLLALNQRRYLELTVPDLGPWRIQNLTETERIRYEDAIWQYDKKGKLINTLYQRAKRVLLVMVSVDAEGKLIFTMDDVDQMADLDSRVVNVIFDAARKHCGFDNAEIESLIKTSGGGATAA